MIGGLTAGHLVVGDVGEVTKMHVMLPLASLPGFLPRVRAYVSLSQSALARRLEKDRSAVSRDEATAYRTVRLSRLCDVLRAMLISTRCTANHPTIDGRPLEDLGSLIATARQSLGITQVQFAESMGVDPSHLCRRERSGYANIRVVEVVRVLAVFDISVVVAMWWPLLEEDPEVEASLETGGGFCVDKSPGPG